MALMALASIGYTIITGIALASAVNDLMGCEVRGRCMRRSVGVGGGAAACASQHGALGLGKRVHGGQNMCMLHEVAGGGTHVKFDLKGSGLGLALAMPDTSPRIPCPNQALQHWQSVLAFGIAQLMLSQMPTLESATWAADVGAWTLVPVLLGRGR